MPVGTGAIQSANVPSEPFVINPDEFNQMTVKNEHTFETRAAVDFAESWERQIPRTGIIGRLVVTLEGELTVSSAAATSSAIWPYGFLRSLNLSANGINNLFSCNGLDLAALRFARNPAYEDATDVFPGTVGGGDTISVATHPIALSWEIPVAMDDVSLVGALYAQSGATTLSLTRELSTAAELFSANPGNCAFTGTVKTSVTRFSVPRSAAEGQPLVIPDLTRMHGFNAVQLPVSSTGDVRLDVIRSAGSLARLFVSGYSAANTPIVATPGATGIDTIALTYGNAQTPYNYDPAWLLLSRNNDYYGAPLPYDRLAFDFVRENAVRDMWLLQGVTDMAAVVGLNSGLTLTNATARLVQETLF